jgi:hypothetical protein
VPRETLPDCRGRLVVLDLTGDERVVAAHR